MKTVAHYRYSGNCPLLTIQKDTVMQTNQLERIDGELPAYTFPGFYPIVYLDSENNLYCAKCATDNDVNIVCSFVHWEGSSWECMECFSQIESAYGDPDA